MKLIKTKFKGLMVYQKETFKDKRVTLRELCYKNILNNFPFDVMSVSKKCFKGYAFTNKKPQAKFITVLKGKIFDVCLDCRKKSKTLENIFQ